MRSLYWRQCVSAARTCRRGRRTASPLRRPPRDRKNARRPVASTSHRATRNALLPPAPGKSRECRAPMGSERGCGPRPALASGQQPGLLAGEPGEGDEEVLLLGEVIAGVHVRQGSTTRLVVVAVFRHRQDGGAVRRAVESKCRCRRNRHRLR
ncbi:hypothetical protein DFJ74DRAFT_696341 [Hyaloraphidium curvatum]|nr:hypothetical protein DFJ74DRAFT_696341 [Hyaloraphidium curvatum]